VTRTIDYFNAAFGEFSPQSDSDAAAKFSLNVLMMDDRMDRLIDLLTPHSEIGGIEGEPGWLLERRDADTSPAGYEKWPASATYRAYVDSESYSLKYPEAYYKAEQFLELVRQALHAYFARNPQKRFELLKLCSLAGLRDN
jgi:hypothetical protein